MTVSGVSRSEGMGGISGSSSLRSPKPVPVSAHTGNDPGRMPERFVMHACGDNPSVIPADMVGCGQPIYTCAEVYRCTHCDVPFHKSCAEKHFQSDNVLTEEMIDEIECREAGRRTPSR